MESEGKPEAVPLHEAVGDAEPHEEEDAETMFEGVPQPEGDNEAVGDMEADGQGEAEEVALVLPLGDAVRVIGDGEVLSVLQPVALWVALALMHADGEGENTEEALPEAQLDTDRVPLLHPEVVALPHKECVEVMEWDAVGLPEGQPLPLPLIVPEGETCDDNDAEAHIEEVRVAAGEADVEAHAEDDRVPLLELEELAVPQLECVGVGDRDEDVLIEAHLLAEVHAVDE